MISLGDKIRQLRRSAGLTQAELAEKAGITGAAISQFEKGTTGPQASTLQKLSTLLHFDLSNLAVAEAAQVTPEGFGGRIETARLAKGMSQAKLASLAGVSRASISLYETGSGNPSTQTLKQLAFFLDVSVDHLLTESEAEAQPTQEDSLVVSATPKFADEARWVCKGCGKELAYSEPIGLKLMLELLRVFMDGHARCVAKEGRAAL